MVQADTLAKLKSIFHALREQPLSPGDPAYVDLFTDGTLSDPNIVSLMATHIEFAASETAQLLGGQDGTGKTTLLRTLKHRLEQNPAYKVVICDMENYLPMTDPVDVVDFLLVAAGALSEALAAPELLGKDAAPRNYWSRFAHWVSKTDIEAKELAGFAPDSDVALALESDPGLRERIREQAKSRAASFRRDVHAYMQECLFELRKHYGEGTQLVVMFDGIEHVRGLSSNADIVADSIGRLFFSHADDLRIPLVHVVFTVPPWLHLHYAVTRRFDTYRQLPCVMVREQPDRPERLGEPNAAGIEVLRKLVEKRGPDGWLDWLLGSPEAFDEIALASGGHLRDLLLMLRAVLVDAHDVGVPVPEERRRRAIEQLGEDYVGSMTNRDAAWLRRVEETHILDASVPVHRIGAFLLFYRNRNGNGWYGLRPVVRAEVQRRASLCDSDAEAIDEDENSTPKTKAAPAFRLVRIELEQIRCFEHVLLDFEHEDTTVDWLLLLGDNAHGKSTLLRAIAIGLCAESEAAALLAATPGQLLRYGQKPGLIALTLRDSTGPSYRSVTEITQEHEGEPEKVRRILELPTEQVFVCAYGPNRTRTADLSHPGYSRHDAVRSLFDYDTSLQNPELVLRRQDGPSRKRTERKLLEILGFDPERAKIEYSRTHGLQIHGPWPSGDRDFEDLPGLSDGYRSTVQWTVDLIGWLVYAGRFARDEEISGIVLIDELEQHLHPRWQRYIIARLHAQFPCVQFIASTHTPLLALGLTDLQRSLIAHLSMDGKERIQTQLVDPKEFRGLRADQVLTSRLAFGLATTRSPKSVDLIARYDELASMQRNDAEEREFVKLRAYLEQTQFLGETPYERRVEAAVRDAISKLEDEALEPVSEDVQEFERQRKLNELFRKEPLV
jgi:energy-coupling factor transporter ATP-binding protein EcfA2